MVRWQFKIIENIVPTNFKHLLQEEVFSEDEFLNRKQYILGFFKQSQTLALSEGSQNPEFGTINIKKTSNKLLLKSTLTHEIIHFLATQDIIKIDEMWEFTTFSGENAQAIKNLVEKGVSLEKAEEVVYTYLSELTETVKEAQALYKKEKK